ncbi:MAG: excinuclease ABC subunit UvrC [Clostridia bacterium]|nr:excinuclease ABC subunit UvrC [Clostridia bacterium]
MGNISDKIKLLPENPGVYVMLDKDGQIIYVGKAKNLKNRVRQYFFNGVKTDKVMAMVSNIADFYYIIAPSEIDALSLENNLIKKHKPRYNILLKDDKTYPYLKINLKDEYPYFAVTRKILKDGSKYFGPFMGGVSVKAVLDIINLAFGLRLCNKKLDTEKAVKPCLNYHIKKCFAPCAKLIDKKAYNENVQGAIDFLSGDVSDTEKLLREKMLFASEREEFELALKYKENLESLEKIKLKRVTSLNKFINADIIAYKSNGIYSTVNLLIVRGGRMLGGKNFSFESVAVSDADAISEFIRRYYKNEVELPDEIITAETLSDGETLTQYFKETYKKSVSIICAKQGVRKQLLDMASVNAEEHLETAVDRIKHKDDMTVSACKSLKDKLNLKNFPKRMECFDISNISGVDKVGSMVVFINGEPDRDSYRRFKIKTVLGADDYKSHQELMRRRLDRLVTDPEKFPKPDLMIIDGGKGQLSAIKEIFDEKGITDIDLIALAEREEEIFTLFSNQPVILERRDYCLRMLQRIRDEAHRFAITYHRTLRGKRSLTSVLDGVKGLGKVKKRALLDKFKDLGGIISAKKEELKTVEGIGEKQAQAIIDTLTKEGLK